MNIAKPQLAGIEVSAVVKELQVLCKSKIYQIYQSESHFFVQVHVPRIGKKIIKIDPGKLIYITSHKPFMDSPNSFCLQLRKHLNGNIILEINQIESQRVIEFVFKDEKKLTLELFSKGNIILTDENDTIIALLNRQRLKERDLKVKGQYIKPTLAINLRTLKEKEFFSTIKKSDKEKIVVTLAKDLGFGGLYSEELCLRAEVDKSMSPKDLDVKQRKELWEKTNQFLKELEKPKGFLHEKHIVAPTLLQTHEKIESYKTFNEALDIGLSKSKIQIEKEQKELLFQKKRGVFERIKKSQEEQREKLEQKSEIATKNGDWIYEHYQEIQTLLQTVKKTKDEKGWNEVSKLLKKFKKITKINLKEKKIEIKTT